MQWPWSKQRRRSEAIGIAIEFGQCAAVHLKMGELVNAFPAKGARAGLDELSIWLAQKKLKGVPQYWVLGRDDYRLHLTDAPAVADDELASALKYRICEQQGLAPEKQAVQAVRLPREAYHARQSMAYAASSEGARIRTLVDWSHEQGLALIGISIREMAMLPILRLMQPETSVAILDVSEDKGYLSLFASGALCLNREIHINRQRLAEALQQPDPQLVQPLDEAEPQPDPSPEFPEAEDARADDPGVRLADSLELEPEADAKPSWGSGFSANARALESLQEVQTLEQQPPAQQQSDERSTLALQLSNATQAQRRASESSPILDNLALEIQRSLDYFDSQLGLGLIGQLWVMNQTEIKEDRLQPSLQARISTPVRPLSCHYFHSESVSNLPDNDLMCYAWGGAILAGRTLDTAKVSSGVKPNQSRVSG